MAKRISIIALSLLLMALNAPEAEARLKSRNNKQVNQEIKGDITITSNISGYWHIQSDQAVSINIVGNPVTQNHLVIQANGYFDTYPVYIPAAQGVDFYAIASSDIKVLITDQ